jgi:hypothetical protein
MSVLILNDEDTSLFVDEWNKPPKQNATLKKYMKLNKKTLKAIRDVEENRTEKVSSIEKLFKCG